MDDHGLDLGPTGGVQWNSLAERSAVGGMLLSPAAVVDVMEEITPADFYDWKHESIARAIGALAAENKPTDVISVTDQLARMGELDKLGGAGYLHELAAEVPTAANAGYYAQIVHNLAVKRRLHEAGMRITAMGSASEGDPLDLVENARAEVDRVTNATRVEVHPIGDTFGKLFDSMTEEPNYVETPWVDLNEFLGGLRPGALYVIGARPASGKTILGLQLAIKLAQHGVVAFSSLEMSEADLQKRMLSQFANVHMTPLMNSTLSDDDWKRIASVQSRLRNAPIYVDDRSGVSITQIKAFARSASRKGKLAGLVVDYLQLISARGESNKPRQEVVAEFSRELKILAKDLGIPVIALSQLNRSPETRISKMPTLADLRESGAIEQDADVVLLLTRDEKSPKRKHLLDVIVAKNRHGRAGKLELLWEGEYARVRSVATAPWSPTTVIEDAEPSLIDRKDLE